jgi:AraC family transcriptional regulator, melibiose operon regulatory protein
MSLKNIVEMKFGLYCGIARVESYDCLHRHDEVEMMFFSKGHPVIWRFGARLMELQADQTVLFWGAIPHQLVSIADENLQHWVVIPPELFLRLDLPAALVRDVMDGRLLMENEPELRRMDLSSYPVWKKETVSDSAEHHRTMLLSLEARLRRFSCRAESSEELGQSVVQKHLPSRDRKVFLDMYEYITRNFRGTIRIEHIAGAVGLHPNYAISLFKSKYGINIVDLITMLRVYEAQRLLLITDLKIIDIAMETGFGSMSNFYKSFCKLCGKTPREYRRAVTRSSPPARV